MGSKVVVYDIGKITDWLSAIGTIGAVIVALYLANRERRPRAMVEASFTYLVDEISGIPNEPITISVRIVNTGFIPIHLKECTVQMDKKRRMVFLDGRHRVEKILQQGEGYEHVLDYHQVKNALRKELGAKNIRRKIYFIDARGKKYWTTVKFNLRE